ncbi:hypothetical protein HYW43_03685, partial [Candidatus Daviesbacteria bacterium]|nr:hypothetical protein [Candidatus Daviesbacteria bacterium]
MGSGGGAGAETTTGLGDGGNGGGIVFISASTVTNSGSISSDGANGGTVTPSSNGSGGGGGSGGSILIRASSMTLGTSLVSASAGSGGGGTKTGGAGGTGRIRLDYDTASGTTSPAVGYIGSLSAPSLLVNRTHSTGDILSLQYIGTEKFKVDSSGNILSATGSLWKPLVDSTTALGIGNSAGTSFVSFDTQNSRVGIGTTGPGSTLTVIGNVGIGTSAAGASIQSNGGAIFWPTTASLSLASGTSLGTYGNIGVGTTTADYNLSVIGTGNFTGNVGIGGSLTVSSLSTFSGNLVPSVNDTYDLGSDSKRWKDAYLGPGTLHIGTSNTDEYTLSYDTTSNYLGFNVNGSGNAEVVMDSNGNLGVGTITPTSLLHLKGADPKLTLEDSTGGQVDFDIQATSSKLIFVQNNTPRLMGGFDDNGNLGIATTGPAVKLEITGGDAELVRLSSTNTTGSPKLTFYQGLTTERAFFQYQDADDSFDINT